MDARAVSVVADVAGVAAAALDTAGLPAIPADPDFGDPAAFAAAFASEFEFEADFENGLAAGECTDRRGAFGSSRLRRVSGWTGAAGFEEPGSFEAPGWDDLDESELTPYEAGPVSRVELLEWELCGADERDAGEAAMLALRAPSWVRLPPGGALATALEDVRPAAESPVALIEVMRACEREIGWLESIKVAAIASFSRQREQEAANEPYVREIDPASGRPADPERSCAAELAAALKLAPNTVCSRIRAARRLTEDLRTTYTSLRTGTITLSKALTVLDSTDHLPADLQRQVEQHVMKRAPEQTHAQLRAALRRAVARVDSRSETVRHRMALSERACRMHQLPDGMAGIWLTHSADRVQALWIAVQALADRAMAGSRANNAAQPQTDEHTADEHTADERTVEQRRADVMVDVFGQILANGTDWLDRPLRTQQRRRPHIEVTVPATTLLGLDEHPAELAGYGPIPAELAREIAADGTWRRLITEPATGVVLEASTTRHDPPAQVSETLLARYPTCSWTGCNRSARECDRDHGTKFRKTGTTRLADLRNYCEYHHVIKDNDHWGWKVQNQPDGSTRIVSPTGHVYITTPPPRGPVAESRATQFADDPDPPPF